MLLKQKVIKFVIRMTEVIANRNDWDKDLGQDHVVIFFWVRAHGTSIFSIWFVYAPHTGLLLCKYTYTLLTCAIIFGPCMGKMVHFKWGLCKSTINSSFRPFANSLPS